MGQPVDEYTSTDSFHIFSDSRSATNATEAVPDASVGGVAPSMTAVERPESLVARRIIRRQRVFLVIAVAAALISTAGLIASTFVKSPAQLAADQGPPSPTVLTAPVVKQILTQTVVIRGTVVAGSTLTITPTAAQGATALVVTRVTKQPGDRVEAGDILVEVSGRPLIVLPGASPAYRDLRPGDTGADIAELQTALKTLGYHDADESGTFGVGTKAAVADLYHHLGYSVPTTGGPGDAADAQALQSAAQAVTTAQRALDAANSTVAEAQAAWDDAKAANPPDQKVLNDTRQGLTLAQQKLSYARQDLASAQRAQAHLVATTGTEMPLNEFAFVPSFPAHMAGLHGDVCATVAAPLVTLNTGALVVKAVLPQGEQSTVKPGLAVQLTAEQLNQQGTATVTSVGPFSSGLSQEQGQGQGQQSNDTAQPSGYPLIVTPSPALSASWLVRQPPIGV